MSFIAVAERLSFRRAADLLEISQSALSKQIGTLESELDVKLFDRSTRQVRLTNAGTTYLQHARSLVREAEYATQRAREASSGLRGEIVIAASTPVAFSDLPRIVRAFNASYTDVDVRIQIMRSSEMPAALAERRIDVALGRAPAGRTFIQSKPLWRHPFHAALSDQHPVARESPVRLTDLNGSALIIYARSLIGETYDQVLALCHDQGFVPTTVESVAGIEPILGYIACGLGVALLPAPWARAIALPELVFRPLAIPERWAFSVSASWHRNETSPLIQAFVDVAEGLVTADRAAEVRS